MTDKTNSNAYQWAAKIVDKVIADLRFTLADPTLVRQRAATYRRQQIMPIPQLAMRSRSALAAGLPEGAR